MRIGLGALTTVAVTRALRAGAAAVLVASASACGWVGDGAVAPDAADVSLKARLDALGGTGALTLPQHGDLASIPQDPRNTLTVAKVALGRDLFHDTGLAVRPRYADRAGTYSCASCHHAKAGFQSGRIQGLGEGGLGFGSAGEGRVIDPMYASEDVDAQPLRSPSTLNVAYQRNMLWSGQFGAFGDNVGTDAAWTAGTPKEKNRLGFEGVETQAVAGIDVHRLAVDRDLVERLGYREAFDAAFAQTGESERYSPVTAGLAIAAYERTLLPNRAPFQRWLKGEYGAMSESQKRGAELFFGKAGCSACHRGPALSSESFHALGMGDLVGPGIVGSRRDDPAHKGRGGFTGRDGEMYRFKTPQLYNLKDAPFLGHGGTFATVEAVIRYKILARAENPLVPASALSSGFVPLGLAEDEVVDLVDFVLNALHDPELDRYQPAAARLRCTPVADPVARVDLACDAMDGGAAPGDATGG